SKRAFSEMEDRRIISLGAVDKQTKTDALAACDVMALPSTQESFGIVFLEAWLMGKPVIGCDIPAVRTVVRDGVDGYLTEQNAGELTERLLALLDNGGLRHSMGQEGRQRALNEFTWDKICQKTLAAYKSALE
ncbi:glycosyltransferase, partial [Candidatus Hydrogenedentota bacterium]